TGYDTLEGLIESAINADQGVFRAAASAGASALSPLAGVVIAGSLLMALCCAWGISRRLAEYRQAPFAARERAGRKPHNESTTENVIAARGGSVAGEPQAQLGGPLSGLAPGSRVAGYVLERLVGVGGMAARSEEHTSELPSR